MYSAHLTGRPPNESEYTGEGNMEAALREDLTRDIAGLTQGWVPRGVLSDGDTVLLAETLAGLRIPTNASLQQTNSSVTDVA